MTVQTRNSIHQFCLENFNQLFFGEDSRIYRLIGYGETIDDNHYILLDARGVITWRPAVEGLIRLELVVPTGMEIGGSYERVDAMFERGGSSRQADFLIELHPGKTARDGNGAGPTEDNKIPGATGIVLAHKWIHTGNARKVLDLLAAAGGDPRFVGGCVRDAIYGVPFKDIDIASNLRPSAAIHALETGGITVVPTGIAHGTVTAVFDDGNIEITTLRRDIDTDGRHAQVQFTNNWLQDAKRRDFTINALSCDGNGVVYDYFNGISDLRNCLIRCVGDAEQRFQEDFLRILRLFRFHGRYGAAALDPDAKAAVIRLAPEIRHLSGERLAKETMKILALPNAADIVALMVQCGVTKHYLPERLSTHYLQTIVAAEHTAGFAADPLRRLGAMLPQCRGFDTADRLKLSTKQRDRLVSMTVLRPDFPMGDGRLAWQKFVYQYGKDRSIDYLLQDTWLPAAAMIDIKELVQEISDWEIPTFPLAGRDLLEIGMEPGKHIGEILKFVESWWVGSGFHGDHDDCLDFAVQRRP